MGRATRTEPAASRVDLVGARPIVLWAALNILNVLDAALTSSALSSGVAYEGNPLVTAMGIPAKLVLVAVAGAALAALYPRALLVPIGALGLVVAYTTVGLLLAS